MNIYEFFLIDHYLIKMKIPLNVIGSGGHAKVIIDAANRFRKFTISVFDDDLNKQNKILCGIKIFVPTEHTISGKGVIAIGRNIDRLKISNRFNQIEWTSIIHPWSFVSDNLDIGEGTVIMAGAIIQPGAKIGRHCIINTGACIDHDCVIDDYVHIAPGVALAGGVKVGEGTLIGVGTSIVPNVTVGKWATIGAGSAVISDIPDYSTAVGVPAIIKKINNESI